MSRSRPTFAGTFAVFAGVALVSAVVLAAIGCALVAGMSTEAGCRSVLAGCGISLLASCAGAIPVSLAVVGRSDQPANAILGSTAIRFLVVLALVAPAAMSGWFDRRVLVASVGVSYLLMLLLDTAFAVRAMKRLSKRES